MESTVDRPSSLTHRDRHAPAREERNNVDDTERMISVIGGAALALLGARRRGMDGALLAAIGGLLVERGVTGHCRVYEALGVRTRRGHPTWLKQQHGAEAVLDASHAERIERTVTIARSAEELYAVWRDLESLPQFMKRIDSVEVMSPTRSRWRSKGVEWEAEIINDIPNRLIAWKATGHPNAANAGSVHFAPSPSGRSTEVRVVLEFEHPRGSLGTLTGKAVEGTLQAAVRDDLRRFKRLMESDESR
jgi:uncharacterized membrane protein